MTTGAANVLVFRRSFGEKDYRLFESVFSYGREVGWRIQVVEYSIAGERRRQFQTGDSSVDVKALLALWRPSGCIVECAGQPCTFPPEDFGKVPVVLLDCDPLDVRRGFACVYNDSASVAAAAARELLALGFKDYAYLPYPADVTWSRERGEMFAGFVRMNGKRFHAGPAKLPLSDVVETNALLSEWLERLPRPCGVFAASDFTASYLVNACARKSVAIPGEIAVLGVDDDERTCENLPFSLSSLRMDVARAGVLAAELLARLMARPHARPDAKAFGVERVCRRASTRLFPAADVRVVKALEFIRRHACDGITPPQVVADMGCSRRLADMRFREIVGHTILDEIHAVRLARVKDLLRRPQTVPSALPDLCGYHSLADLRRVFRRYEGMTMCQYQTDRFA